MKSIIWIFVFCILLIVDGWYMSYIGYYKGSLWNSQFEAWFGVLWGITVISFVVSAIVLKITEKKQLRKGAYELYEYLRKERFPLSSIILYSEHDETLVFDLSEKLIAYIKVDNEGDYYHYQFEADEVLKSEIIVNNKVVSSVCCKGFLGSTSSTHVDSIIQQYISKRKLFMELKLCLYTQINDIELIEIKLLSIFSYYVKSEKSIKLIIDSASRWQNTVAKL